NDPGFDRNLPTVLSAHIAMTGSDLVNRFRLSAEEDVIFEETSLLDGFAYVALGHIHKAQFLNGRLHVRYSGSIERLDLGESNDDKSVVLVDVGPQGLRSDPMILPLDATPIYVVQVPSPREQLPLFREQFADCRDHLVRIECTYTAGVDNREDTLREL